MTIAADVVSVYKKILDVSIGDVPIGCVYVADGIYASVLTDTEPYRVAFYDFTVSHEPFFIVGEKTYDPRADGKDGVYFYPFVVEALYAFLRLFVSRDQVRPVQNPDIWDWDRSPRVLVAFHHMWRLMKKSYPKSQEITTRADYFVKGESSMCVWIWNDELQTVTAFWGGIDLNGQTRGLGITYDGKALSNVRADWGIHLDGNDTLFCKAIAHIPFNPALQ
jgi:hypothetical protein